MGRDLTLAMRMSLDSQRFVAGLTSAQRGVRSFANAARREMDAFKGALGSVQGQLAQLGIAVGVTASIIQSARMDKSLAQLGQTAGVSRAEVESLRKELFRMASETGQSVDDLQLGFTNAVASGLSFREAFPVIDATNKAMAVTGASADRLTAGLTVAATAFNFDLSKPGQALTLLDKMSVAGRQGSAELQNLSDIFGRVGVNAASAGFGFDKTLAFIEGLSRIERQPERLGTLVDSTVRLFTNKAYRDQAEQATGVRFTDSKGMNRDPIAVLREIKNKYDRFKTDAQRDKAINMAFGKADLDTIKGLRALLGTDILSDVEKFEKSLSDAGGSLERDLPAAISNAVDQTGRLKAELRTAADGFAQPINDALQGVIKWGLDKKDNGGLGLDGKDILAGGAAGGVATWFAARYGSKAISSLAKTFGSTAFGVAEGKALESVAGVTPVFVVNMPGTLGPGGTIDTLTKSPAGKTGKALGAGGVARAAGIGALPLAVIYGASEMAGDTSKDQERSSSLLGVSSVVKRLLSGIGLDKDAEIEAIRQGNRRFLNADSGPASGDVRVQISLDQDGRVASLRASSTSERVPVGVDPGVNMFPQ